MTGWIVTLGVLVFFALLLHIPILVTVSYRETFVLTVWFLKKFTFRLEDMGKDKKEAPKPKVASSGDKRKTRKKKPASGQKQKKDWKEFARMLWDLVKASGVGFRVLFKRIKIYNVFLKITVAGEDAAETAITYGKISGGVYFLLGFLKTHLNLKVKKIEIVPDFDKKQLEAEFFTKIRIFPATLLWAALRILFRFLKITLGKMIQSKKQKVVNAHE